MKKRTFKSLKLNVNPSLITHLVVEKAKNVEQFPIRVKNKQKIPDLNMFKRHLNIYLFSKVFSMYYGMCWYVSVFVVEVKLSFDDLWLNWSSIN